ncbi:MAG: hypothetical protein WDN48_03770 [Pseudolabrys sp.]
MGDIAKRLQVFPVDPGQPRRHSSDARCRHQARHQSADIASIINETYATVKSHFSSKAVETVMAARVSVPYCVAVAALDRKVGQAQFAADRVAAADVRDLLARTEVVAVPELTALYPEKFPARVTITLRNGEKLTAMRNFPTGDPQQPLSAAELEAKFWITHRHGLSPPARAN